jgi:hypothetical protein
MKKKPLPTHAEEVDVLRLQMAQMKFQQLQEQCAAAGRDLAALMNAAEKKYGYSAAKGDVIKFDTFEIVRVLGGAGEG